MLLRLFAYVIIPVYTIYLALQGSLLESNLSVICSDVAFKKHFIIWTLMIITFIYFVLTAIIKKYQLLFQKTMYGIIISSCILFFLSSITPYLPTLYPDKAKYHVFFAFSATVLLLLSFLLITWQLKRIDNRKYHRYFLYCIVIDAISFFMFTSIGIISGLLELFITISCACLAARIFTLCDYNPKVLL